jgi:hypothetical protein
MGQLEIKVGDKFWQYDSNRRVYDSNRNLIPESRYFQITIEKETSRSWIDNNGHKHPKKNPFSKRYGGWGREYGFLTDEMKEDRIWAGKNESRIIETIRGLPPSELRKVGEFLSNLIGD